MTEEAARRELVAAGRQLVTQGLVARSWGNVSLRLGGSQMMVTPSGILWNDLTESMLSVVDLETGKWAGAWKPSGERKVHQEIYRQRPEIGAVVHTHQSAASVCAAARVSVPWAEGVVPCAPYALPGTKALTHGTVGALGSGTAVLMANHGVFVVGATLSEAFDRIRELEAACAGHIQEQAVTELPAPPDAPWDRSWMTTLTTDWPGAPSWLSRAPYTELWSRRGLPLPALLDDLAQLAGARVECRSALPKLRPKNEVVFLQGQGACVGGSDAEALAMVVEKACRAALGAAGLGGAKPFPAWEAQLMRLVYKNAYAKQARR